MTEDEARWPLPLVRAVLEPAILAVLAEQPLHGYAIAARLAEAGLGRLRGGSLYPVLARLQEAALVEPTWEAGESGPGRRTYAITTAGRERLEADLDGLGALHAALDRQARRGGTR